MRYMSGGTNTDYKKKLFELLGVLVEVLLGGLVAPVLQSLSDHRTDVHVVPGTASLHYLGDQIVLPPPLLPRTLAPPADLSLIILCPPTLVEPAVPLEPTIGVLSTNQR